MLSSNNVEDCNCTHETGGQCQVKKKCIDCKIEDIHSMLSMHCQKCFYKRFEGA